MRKIINHHIEGGTRESHPRVQDLQHPRLGKPRRGLQILDTQMGFPRPSLNVVLDSINSKTLKDHQTLITNRMYRALMPPELTKNDKDTELYQKASVTDLGQ